MPAFFNLLFDSTDVKGLFTLDLDRNLGIDCTGWSDAEVVAHAQRMQARDEDLLGVYFNTGVLDSPITDAESRNAEACIGSRLFFIDIDFRTSKHKTAMEVLTAVLAFIKATGLPKPNAVNTTGGGIHILWVLEDLMAPDEWRPYSQALVDLMIQHGIQADYHVTKNIVSLLRVPNTENKKYDGWPVVATVAGGDPNRIPNERFLSVLNAVVPTALKDLIPGDVPDLGVVTSKAEPLNQYEDDNPTAEQLLAACGVVRWAKENQNSVPEPLWRAVLSQAVETEEGESFAHQISCEHDGYSDLQTQQKIERLTGPMYCDTMKQEMQVAGGADVCSACPARLRHEKKHGQTNTSPINIARRAAEPEPIAKTDPLTKLTGFTVVKVDEIELPDGYVERGKNKWLFQTYKDDKGNEKTKLVQKSLVRVAGIYQKKASDDDEQAEDHLVRIVGVNNSELLYSCWDATPTGDKLARLVLGRLGMKVDNPKAFAMYVNDKIEEATMTNTFKRAYKQYGWHDGYQHFIYGPYKYRAGRREDTVVDVPSINHRFKPVGDAQVFPDVIKRFYSSREAAHLALAVAVAFGSLLTGLVGGGRAAVILRSQETGTGKSSAIETAVSAFNEPVTQVGIFRSATDSQLSFMEQCSGANNLPIFMEELPQEFANDMAGFFKQITEGQVKSRLNRNNDGTLRQTDPFNNICMFTTNHDIAAEFQTRGGAIDISVLSRLIEIHCPPTLATKGDTLELSRLIHENYGWAAHQFVAALTTYDPAALRGMIEVVIKQLKDELKFDAGARLQYRTMACILVAARIAQQADIFPVDINILYEAALDVLRANFARMGDVSWENNAPNWLRFTLFEYEPRNVTIYEGGSYKGTLVDPNDATKRAQDPFARMQKERAIGNCCYVNKRWLREQLKMRGQMPYRELVSKLRTMGIVLEDDVRVRMLGSATNGEIYLRCIKINVDRLDEVALNRPE